MPIIIRFSLNGFRCGITRKNEEVKNPLSNWYIWEINTDLIHVGKLPKEYWDIVEPGGVKPYVEIISRIKFGYYRYTSVIAVSA